MKTHKTNIQKMRFEDYSQNFKYTWVFGSNGLVSQSHDENEYREYLDSNYISKSNQEL